MSVIADLNLAGVDPNLVQRVVEAIADAERSSAINNNLTITPIAAAVKHLIAAGVTGDALVTAIADIEASLNPVRERSSGAERTRRWRERKASQSVTCDGVTSQASQASQNDPSRAEYDTTRAPALIPVGLSNDNPPINNPLLVPPSPGTAPRKASRAKARTQIDENQLPTEADSRNAEEAGLTGKDLVAEWRRFRDHHRAKGSLMADWSAAWRTWLGNRDRFAQPRAGPTRERGGFATMLMQSIEATNGRKNASNSENLPALSFDPGAAGSGKTGHDGGIFGRLPRPDG